MSSKPYAPEEPIAAIATALVPSALGIIRTSGKNAVSLVAKLFSRPKALLNAKGNTIVYGWIIDPENQNQKIDEVMVAVYREGKSFTGEEMAEIFCHGGTAPVLRIYNLLLANGFRSAEKGEYTFRAFINGKSDLTKAEAVREIIGSKTDLSRSHAAQRLEGGLLSEIEDIKKQMLHAIATLEVEIEYPEDEENIADSFDSTELRQIKARLEKLSSSWAAEKLYQEGAQVVLCGKTNAGKSSLFNALLKEERAIVSDIRGTTRDWLESFASFGGVPVRLFDTAGLRETDDVIEKTGVERTKDLITKADVILYVADSTVALDQEDNDFLSRYANGTAPFVLVLNKDDKTLGQNQVNFDKQKFSNVSAVKISAKTGSGIAELISFVKNLLEKQAKRENDIIGLGSERQKIAVEEALDSINHALIAAEQGFTLDAAVQDIEDAISCLAELTGEVTPDDILESVFSSFCVGK